MFSDHVVGDGPRFRKHVCKMKLEGVISKRLDRAYAPGDRGLWVKSKCLNREEFVVIDWTDPAGSRSHIGALLLGYYSEDGQLHYAGRVGTGMADAELKRLAAVLKPLQVKAMPLDKPPPRESRFGSPLELSRVHWLRPEVVVEVAFSTWTTDGLIRQASYQGQCEDKAAGGRCTVECTSSLSEMTYDDHSLNAYGLAARPFSQEEEAYLRWGGAPSASAPSDHARAEHR